MANTRHKFTERMEQLAREVGDGRLTGRVGVDQRYAEVQERNESFTHPRGGQARYLEASLQAQQVSGMQHLAREVITENGSRVTDAMRDITEEISRYETKFAPVDTGALRKSAHPTVEDEGHVVYDRPPVQPRLTDEQLRRRRNRRPGR